MTQGVFSEGFSGLWLAKLPTWTCEVQAAFQGTLHAPAWLSTFTPVPWVGVHDSHAVFQMEKLGVG